MITETIQSDEMISTEYGMDSQEWAEFQRDYARWCVEVELDNIKILNNKESRSE
jgi:hypothetical protein